MHRIVVVQVRVEMLRCALWCMHWLTVDAMLHRHLATRVHRVFDVVQGAFRISVFMMVRAVRDPARRAVGNLVGGV